MEDGGMTTTLDKPRAGKGFAGKKLTEDELLALPDDGRKYELVDGRAKEVPTGARHGRIGTRLIRLLGPYADEHGELFDSNTGFRMASGNIRSPGVAFVSRLRRPDGPLPMGFLNGAPDLAVEIISPSEDEPDRARKVVECLASGAQQVWQVFPESRRVVVYESLDRVRSLGAGEELDGGDLLPNFRCRVSDLMPEE
jgi:Uma2 family endonuclease